MVSKVLFLDECNEINKLQVELQRKFDSGIHFVVGNFTLDPDNNEAYHY
jgi:hypothetical protein